MAEEKIYGQFKDFVKKNITAQFMLKIAISKNKVNLPRNISFPELLDISVYHGLHYILKDRMSNIGKENLAKLDLMERAVISRNKNYEKIFKDISAELHRAKIAFVPVKGITRLKNNSYKRPMKDIDLWIEKRNLNLVRKILVEKYGYKPIKNVENPSTEFCVVKNGMFVECKDISNQFNMNIQEFEKSKLKNELLFCYEASHALLNHSYGAINWFYDGYILMQNQNLSIKKILEAAKISKTEKVVKTYILIINRLFGLIVDKKYFSEKDYMRADLYFTLHNPLMPMAIMDVLIARSFIQISNTSGITRFSYFYRTFVKQKSLLESRKKIFGFFKYAYTHPLSFRIFQCYISSQSFYRWMKKKEKCYKTGFSEKKEMEKHLPFYLWYMNKINVMTKDEIIEHELTKIYEQSKFMSPDKLEVQVRKIFCRYSPEVLRDKGNKLKIKWLVDAWFGKLKILDDVHTKKWKNVLQTKNLSSDNKYKTEFVRRILLSRSILSRIRLFITAMFPSSKISKSSSKKNLLIEWASHIKNADLWRTLIKAVFTFPR